MNRKAELERELQSLEKQLNLKQKDLSDTNKKKEKAEEELTQQLSKLEKMVVDANAAREEVEQLETEIFDLEHQLKKVSKSLEKLDEREKAERKNERLEKNLARVRELISGFEVKEEEPTEKEETEEKPVKKVEVKEDRHSTIVTSKPVTQKKPLEGFFLFERGGFSLEYPATWELTPNESESSVLSLSNNKGVALDISIESKDSELSFQELVEQIVTGMKESLNAEITSKNIEEEKAELTFSITQGDSKLLYRFQLVEKNEKIYSVLIKAPATEYMNSREETTHIFKSIKY